jgi:exodeoxyribonuclease VII small subunit
LQHTGAFPYEQSAFRDSFFGGDGTGGKRRGKEMSEITDLSFEEAFAELEETVTRLEDGDLSLEESITLFERGQALAAYCNTKLDKAELKVRQLLPDNPDEIAPFDVASS